MQAGRRSFVLEWNAIRSFCTRPLYLPLALRVSSYRWVVRLGDCCGRPLQTVVSREAVFTEKEERTSRASLRQGESLPKLAAVIARSLSAFTYITRPLRTVALQVLKKKKAFSGTLLAALRSTVHASWDVPRSAQSRRNVQALCDKQCIATFFFFFPAHVKQLFLRSLRLTHFCACRCSRVACVPARASNFGEAVL